VLRDLVVGSHLFLPVAKPGGRIWLGDVHALQGDGVVDQTAIESAAEDLEIRYDLHKQVALPGPVGEAVARSVLLIIDPAAPPAIRAAALITQELRRDGGSWRIARRTVARAAGQR
jgi:acetamidase/formamidase